MRLALAWAMGTIAASAAAAGSPDFSVSSLTSPVPESASSPTLTTDRHGRTWMGWIETDDGTPSFYCSELGGPGGWGAKVLVAADAAGQRAALQASPNGRLAAVFSLKGGGFLWTQSADGGRDWMEPKRHAGGFGAVAASLENGSLLAAWADGGGSDQIHVQYLTGPYAAAPAYVLERNAVSPSLRLIPLLDGGAAAIYGLPTRPISSQVARLHGRRWGRGRPILAKSTETTEGLPLFFESADADGGRIEVVWSVAATTWASISPDAGARFTAPVALGSTLVGRIKGTAVALLHDTSAIVAIQSSGGAWVQRISPDGVPGMPFPFPETSDAGPPAIALAHDYEGAASQATLVVAIPNPKRARISTYLVEVPEADLLSAAAEACHCSPTAQQLQGYSVRGTVVKIDTASRQLTLNLDSAPGVMDAGEHTFALADSEHPILAPADECLGRIDLTPDGWRIFDLRRLGR